MSDFPYFYKKILIENRRGFLQDCLRHVCRWPPGPLPHPYTTPTHTRRSESELASDREQADQILLHILSRARIWPPRPSAAAAATATTTALLLERGRLSGAVGRLARWTCDKDVRYANRAGVVPSPKGGARRNVRLGRNESKSYVNGSFELALACTAGALFSRRSALPATRGANARPSVASG